MWVWVYTNARVHGMDAQVTSVLTDSDTLAALGAFQFNIALKVPWVMRSIVVSGSGCLHHRSTGAPI